jgi:hypothetical protein
MEQAVQTGAGAWMQTFSGEAYHPVAPHPEEVSIEDIAHALAHQCRYGGHCTKFYSVAEHSFHVSKVIEAKWTGRWMPTPAPVLVASLAGLLHDASEAYLVDMPRPVKMQLPDYWKLEDKNMAAIAEKFGLPPMFHHWTHVKKVDCALLADERRQIMTETGVADREWGITEPATGTKVRCWKPATAKRKFLKRFHDLVYRINRDSDMERAVLEHEYVFLRSDHD